MIDPPGRPFHHTFAAKEFRVVALGGVIAIALATIPESARAVLDIADRGPILQTGKLMMRVTNAGILGNAFFHEGLSSDPSFEFPAYSGQECLNFAALWVGAVNAEGAKRVSGGPLMEWRPTVDPADRVQIRQQGDIGTRRMTDDDLDFRSDEEQLNGRDDDGDGKVDEDVGIFSQQMLGADYTDDRPEAAYVSDGGETHQGMGLSVHQEVYGWTAPGHEGIVGVQFRIRNHGSTTLRDLHVGLFADLDSRRHNDGLGHLNDEVVTRSAARTFARGASSINVGTQRFTKGCFSEFSHTGPVVIDGLLTSGLPAVTVVPLSHTTDPIAFFRPQYARAPARFQFKVSTMLNGYPARQGGVPLNDGDRYAALAGELPPPSPPIRGDVALLVSCGPFPTLAPGETIDFAVAIVAGANPDSVVVGMENAALDYDGPRLNLQADAGDRQWYTGNTGITGHEACIRAPLNVTFVNDPHCPEKFWYQYPHMELEPDFPSPTDRPSTYTHLRCIWTDADCDPCTGIAGEDTILAWSDPGQLPPMPNLRFVPGDGEMVILWDDYPEALMRDYRVNTGIAQFTGYNLYRLNGWRGREGLLPPIKNWSLIATFDRDTSYGAALLSTITDPTVTRRTRSDGLVHYPIGRYRYVDREVLNGFDYLYVVTTRAVIPSSETRPIRESRESAFVVRFSDLVTPRESARTQEERSKVWVVPNPFRGGASWDRPEVRGDVLTRHIDFMGMPQARATIRIWTLAGDLVAVVEHDGSGGHGQARWNLVSRSGQDVSSGVYFFTVESTQGSQTGRFVIMR